MYKYNNVSRETLFLASIFFHITYQIFKYFVELLIYKCYNKQALFNIL